MQEDHPVFKIPEDVNAKIWRFMDFTKYVSLLERKALFFSRSDKLGDPFEGSVSKMNLQMRPVWYNEVLPKISKMIQNVHMNLRFHTYLNCWHINEIESDAMWKLYLKNSYGVAIQSTYKRFRDCFDPKAKEIFIGKILYIDYEKEVIPENNSYWPFVHKRESFEHENELRAVIQRLPKKGEGDISTPPATTGIYVPANLDSLIENIYLAPTSPSWFDEIVKSINEKYGIKQEIKSSKLSERPVY